MGAFFVTFVGLLAQVMPLGEAIGLLALGGYLVTIVATLLLPETQGMALDTGTMVADKPAHAEKTTAAQMPFG